MPKPNKYDRAHQRNLRRYQKQIDAIYAAAAQEAAAIGGLVQNLDPDKIFSFADYPITHDRVRKLLAKLASEMEMCIVNGVRSEWTLANSKNNALCDRVFGENKLSLPYEAQRRYYATNDTALEAFLKRQTDGLNLSDRVWRYTDAFKQEIELGLDLGIRSGQDARAMAKDLKTFLRFPDKLFRRVRDEHGELQLSKAAAAFHPGRGVCRSSYKNALRLAATETNIAYRTADHERWQQMDFVVGQEVRCSDTNHPVEDICDTLAGRYPKDFKFVGWHPNCRCYVIPVLKTEEEMDADCQRILRGEDPLPPEDSENVVEDVPAAFNEWVDENAERTSRARQLPYFIADNPQYVQMDLGERFAAHNRGMSGVQMLGRAENRYLGELKSDPTTNAPIELSQRIAEDCELFCQEVGVDFAPMTFAEADGTSPNADGFDTNCQSAVVVYEARRRGIHITALSHSEDKSEISNQLGENGALAFVDKRGQTPSLKTIGGDKRRMEAALKKTIQTDGRYHIGMDFNAIDGHIIVAEKMKGHEVVFYDALDGGTWSLGEIITRAKSISVLRVDNLRFNHAVLKGISRRL